MKKEAFLQAISQLKELLDSLDFELIRSISENIALSIKNGGKVLICGNGGSAADAQHMAAEFVNRFLKERKPLPAIALTVDSSVLTSIANDYDFNDVFAKQVEAIGNEGDILIGISTSGNSENVFNALSVAKDKGMKTIGFLGKDGGKILPLCDYAIVVKSNSTPRIQEIHEFVMHTICQMVEDELF
ncbi:D-sedoheptulose 7-phosphate isomerase [Hippea maritima]|uniref:Phosphoheptose isomerase n=1 Tax=Hippea maritima (strain ATCC 700847 / DSM 10411 / MH2) TaxID=760142 RepID=F2LTQ7_HIPMA|nr:D-sedoheptulose 7-phosphate isomerase [Hippea maritima]AEA34433.1 Phosphoheptose isomerase [Hippea maritima DSM 10411]